MTNLWLECHQWKKHCTLRPRSWSKTCWTWSRMRSVTFRWTPKASCLYRNLQLGFRSTHGWSTLCSKVRRSLSTRSFSNFSAQTQSSAQTCQDGLQAILATFSKSMRKDFTYCAAYICISIMIRSIKWRARPSSCQVLLCASFHSRRRTPRSQTHRPSLLRSSVMRVRTRGRHRMSHAQAATVAVQSRARHLLHHHRSRPQLWRRPRQLIQSRQQRQIQLCLPSKLQTSS
mmetsp:Transcript_9514/g.25403  ORF Transcript_9514/g.25403 Transcript_9514/m.25403 type:complete len:230 (-) Transcript_9514:1459-2148(-)